MLKTFQKQKNIWRPIYELIHAPFYVENKLSRRIIIAM